MKIIDDATAGTPKLSVNRSYLSLARNNRDNDAILLVLGVVVIIALLWVAGVDRSQDQGRSDVPEYHAPIVTTAAGH